MKHRSLEFFPEEGKPTAPEIADRHPAR